MIPNDYNYYYYQIYACITAGIALPPTSSATNSSTSTQNTVTDSTTEINTENMTENAKIETMEPSTTEVSVKTSVNQPTENESTITEAVTSPVVTDTNQVKGPELPHSESTAAVGNNTFHIWKL